MIRKAFFFLLACLIPMIPAVAAPDQQNGGDIELAYVLANEVWLADGEGHAVINTGLALDARQAATLFWSPDGESLYIATRDGLFIATAGGSTAVRLPGVYGLTITMARHGGLIYNLDIDNPQEVDDTHVAYPIRESNIASATEGRGRLINYLGSFEAAAGQVSATHAAALYARDNGIMGAGRPHLWATYGTVLFYSAYFPNAGLGAINLASGDIFPDYDTTFLPGAAAVNDAASRLAAPTTEGLIRTIDLISEGWRDYPLQSGLGYIERMAWALDDSAIYFVEHQQAQVPLSLSPTVTYTADVRSSFVQIWRLDLVTGRSNPVTDFGDVFGISSIAVTRDYLYVVVVERNEALIGALNRGEIPPNIAPTDPMLNNYIPRTVLWRIDPETGEKLQLSESVWGVTARPN